MHILPRNLNKEVKLKNLVTNPNPLENDSVTYSSNGVFSQAIFGNMSTGNDWSCTCGEKQTNFCSGVLCEICNTRVEYKGLMLQREGWVYLVEPLIHPLFFSYIRRIVGGTTLNKIIGYKSDITVDGTLIDSEISPPYHNIGIQRFIHNYKEILGYFNNKSKKSKQKEFDFVVEHEEYLFVSYFPIINSRLRPAVVINGEFSFDKINNNYNFLIQNSQYLDSLSLMEKNDLNILPLMYKSQIALNDIFTTIIENLSAKEGYIRNTIFGSRLNFTSRMVITPLPIGYDIDDVILPYSTALEFLKPQIIRRITELKKCNYSYANSIYFNATLNFSRFVFSIANTIIKENPETFSIMINRNPTINIGSILNLKVRGIKEDIYDLTASIHNLILVPLNGDYDGDVLNFVAIFGLQFNKLFRKYRPSNILYSPASGKFNKAFLPTKDTILGLETLFIK